MSVAQVERPQRRRGSEIAGAALVVLGIGLLLEQAGVVTVSRTVVFSIALVVIGLGLIVLPVRRYGPAVVTGLVFTVLLAASTIDGPARGSVGELFVSPASVSEAEDGYSVLMGSMKVDLSRLRPTGTVRIPLNVGLGELIVDVPANVEVRADVEIAGGGEFQFLGERLGSGLGITRSASTDAFSGSSGRIVLVIEVGSGVVEVRRAGF